MGDNATHNCLSMGRITLGLKWNDIKWLVVGGTMPTRWAHALVLQFGKKNCAFKVGMALLAHGVERPALVG